MASGMQKLGVEERVIEAVLGHSSASRNGLLRVYQQHDFSLEKRAALDRGPNMSPAWPALSVIGGVHSESR